MNISNIVFHSEVTYGILPFREMPFGKIKEGVFACIQRKTAWTCLLGMWALQIVLHLISRVVLTELVDRPDRQTASTLQLYTQARTPTHTSSCTMCQLKPQKILEKTFVYMKDIITNMHVKYRKYVAVSWGQS